MKGLTVSSRDLRLSWWGVRIKVFLDVTSPWLTYDRRFESSVALIFKKKQFTLDDKDSPILPNVGNHSPHRRREYSAMRIAVVCTSINTYFYFPANIRMYPVRPSFNSSHNMDLSLVSPIPVAARSKAWVCGRSLAGIVSSNPVGGMDVNVVCCQLEVSATGWSLVQASSTGCGVTLCVIRHKNNPLHLQEVVTRYRTKKKEKLSILKSPTCLEPGAAIINVLFYFGHKKAYVDYRSQLSLLRTVAFLLDWYTQHVLPQKRLFSCHMNNGILTPGLTHDTLTYILQHCYLHRSSVWFTDNSTADMSHIMNR